MSAENTPPEKSTVVNAKDEEDEDDDDEDTGSSNGEEEEDAKSAKSKKKKEACPTCKKEVVNLKQHKRTHEAPKLKCFAKDCTHSTRSKQNLQNHMRRKHPEDSDCAKFCEPIRTNRKRTARVNPIGRDDSAAAAAVATGDDGHFRSTVPIKAAEFDLLQLSRYAHFLPHSKYEAARKEERYLRPEEWHRLAENEHAFLTKHQFEVMKLFNVYKSAAEVAAEANQTELDRKELISKYGSQTTLETMAKAEAFLVTLRGSVSYIKSKKESKEFQQTSQERLKKLASEFDTDLKVASSVDRKELLRVTKDDALIKEAVRRMLALKEPFVDAYHTVKDIFARESASS